MHKKLRRERRLLPQLKRLVREIPEVRKRLLGSSEGLLAARLAKRILPRDRWQSLKEAVSPTAATIDPLVNVQEMPRAGPLLPGANERVYTQSQVCPWV